MQDVHGLGRESSGAGLAAGAVILSARDGRTQPARQSPTVTPSQPITER